MGWGTGNLGGGSGGLNFKIVGGTSTPSSPKENTIWVKTEKIGAWYFSATQPEGMQEWDVWFPTGIESDVEFNALKKNGLHVYPTSAKQYVNSALVDLEAKSYLNGAWVEWWDGYYYRAGNEYENITGGWVIKEKKGTKNGTLGTLTKQEDGLVINLTGKSCGACLRTEEKVDLTDIKKISIAWFFDSGSISGGSFFVTDSISVGEWDWNNKAVTSGDVLNLSSADIDVSALQGEFYVCLSVDYAHGNVPATTKLRVTEVGTV